MGLIFAASAVLSLMMAERSSQEPLVPVQNEEAMISIIPMPEWFVLFVVVVVAVLAILWLIDQS